MKKGLTFLMAILLIWIASHNIIAQDYRAVFVGISDYNDPNWPDLGYPQYKAQELRMAFINHQGWPSSYSKLQLKLNSQATEDAIKTAVGNMPAAGGNRTNLFFYDGHGDSEDLYDPIFVHTDGLVCYPGGSGRLTPNELQNRFQGRSSNKFCCFINACGAGIFPRDMSYGVISSGATTNTGANWNYSDQLIKGVKNNKADPDGIISAEDLHTYIANHIGYAIELKDCFSGELLLGYPLSVTISGPTDLGYNQTGTFTVNPKGGSHTYTNFKWWKRWDDGESMLSSGGPIILAPPPGEWQEVIGWEGLQTVQTSSTVDFSLKCRVYDNGGATAEDIHSVIIIGGASANTLSNGEISSSVAPESFAIHPNYPNPFNPKTTIRYDLAHEAYVFLAIYDIKGGEMVKLCDGRQPAGFKEVTWDASAFGSGIYLYRLRILHDGQIVLNDAGKMMLVK